MEGDNNVNKAGNEVIDFQNMSILELQRFLESVNCENERKATEVENLVQLMKPKVIQEILEAQIEGKKLDDELIRALSLDVADADANSFEESNTEQLPGNTYTIIGMRKEKYTQISYDYYDNEYEEEFTKDVICCTKAGKKYEIALFLENIEETDEYEYIADSRMQISEVDEFGTITYLPRRKINVEIPQEDTNSFDKEPFICDAFICGNSRSNANHNFFLEKATNESQDDLNKKSLKELRFILMKTRYANNEKSYEIENAEKQKKEEIERAKRIEQERKNELIQAISSAQKKGKELDKEISTLKSDEEKMMGKKDAEFTLNQILSTLLTQNQSQQI